MVDHDDDIDVGDNDEIDDADDERVSVDPVAAALALTDLLAEFSKAYKLVTTDKAKAARLRAVAKLDRRAAAAEQKFAAITAQAEQVQAALDARAAALDERERAITQRESSFEASLHEAHDSLRQYHDNLAQEDKRIRYRILSYADLLHGYNAQLQSLPDWPAIKQLVPDLPADLPAAPVAEIVSENVREDWTGQHSFIADSSLTRSVRGAA